MERGIYYAPDGCAAAGARWWGEETWLDLGVGTLGERCTHLSWWSLGLVGKGWQKTTIPSCLVLFPLSIQILYTGPAPSHRSSRNGGSRNDEPKTGITFRFNFYTVGTRTLHRSRSAVTRVQQHQGSHWCREPVKLRARLHQPAPSHRCRRAWGNRAPSYYRRAGASTRT